MQLRFREALHQLEALGGLALGVQSKSISGHQRRVGFGGDIHLAGEGLRTSQVTAQQQAKRGDVVLELDRGRMTFEQGLIDAIDARGVVSGGVIAQEYPQGPIFRVDPAGDGPEDVRRFICPTPGAGCLQQHQ